MKQIGFIGILLVMTLFFACLGSSLFWIFLGALILFLWLALRKGY
jgi:hypothetical protein